MCRRAVHAEADGPSGDRQLRIVGGEGQVVEFGLHQQGTGEMDSVEGSKDRGERLRGSLEDASAHLDQTERLDALENGPPMIRHSVVVESVSDASAIDRSHALEADELARDGNRDLGPDAHASTLTQDRPEED